MTHSLLMRRRVGYEQMYLPCGTLVAVVVVLILKDKVNLARGACLRWDEVLVEEQGCGRGFPSVL